MTLIIQEKPLEVLVEKIQEKKVFLILPTGQRLTLAKKYFPANIKSRDVFLVDFVRKECFGADRREMAKLILKEILEGENS